MTTGPESRTPRTERSFLSDKKFQKHLESLTEEERDALDFDDEESLREEYELFTSTETVREGLSRMWPAHMEDAFGIRLGKEGRTAIDAYLRQEMRENPEKIEEFAGQLETFRSNRERIRDLEAQLVDLQAAAARHGQEAVGHRRQAAIRQGQAGNMGWWSRLRGRAKPYEQAASRASVSAEASAEQQRIAQENAALAERSLSGARASHESGRDAVVNELLQQEALARLVRDKVDAKFTKMLRPGGPKDFRAIAEASELIGKYGRVAEDADAEDAMSVDDLREKVDTLAERRAKAEVTKAIRAVKVGYRYEKLQEKLDAFVNLNPIGTKEHEDARDFVIETFDGEIERLDEEMKTDSKAILRRAMMGMLKAQVEARYESDEDELVLDDVRGGGR